MIAVLVRADGHRCESILESLIYPMTTDQFIGDYWEKHPYQGSGLSRSWLSSLLKVDDFEELVSSVMSPLDGWFSVVRGHAARPTAAMLTDEGSISLSDVASAYGDDRATLLLTKLHKRKASVAELCRGLEASLLGIGFPLRSRIGANAYLTPPKAAGFARHYDDHCVLVVQLSGEKSWMIFGPDESFPLPGRVSGKNDSNAKIEMECRLVPGDVLYVPRGHLHEARANQEASLHLTLSIYSYTWRDLLHEMIDGVEECRKSIDPRLFKDDQSSGALLREIEGRLQQIGSAEEIENLLEQMKDRALMRMDLLPGGILNATAALGSISDESTVVRRMHTLARVNNRGDEVVLTFGGVRLSAAVEMEPVFRFVADCPRFRVADVPRIGRPYDRIGLIRGLIRDGLLSPG
jgi:hypothetical protein